MDLSQKFLWEVQLREWPESIVVSVDDMLYWTDSIKSQEVRERVYRSMVCCLNGYAGGLFYRTSDKPNAFVGYRHGMDGAQYVSGFPLWNGEYGC